MRFVSEKTFHSEKNGDILVRRFFGSVELVVGNCFQSGPYMEHLFRKLLRAIPVSYAPKRILLLGLGGGSAVREIARRFPKAHIVAMEYDPVMVEIARTEYLKPNELERTEILVGDAKDQLATPQKPYDLILLDIFRGSSASPLLETPEFIQLLASRLCTDGYLAVNFYKQKESLSVFFERAFSPWKDVRYSLNRMVLYRHFGQGKIGDRLPDGFLDKHQSRIFQTVEAMDDTKKEVIGEDGSVGMRTDYGLFCVDTYVSATEPVLQPCVRPRYVIWRPTEHQKKVDGWKALWFDEAQDQRGVGIVTEENKQAYWKSWSPHAQRHREKWVKEDRYEIAPVTFEEFSNAFHASKKIEWLTRTGFLRVLKFRLDRHPDDVRLYGAREIASQELIAGLAVVQYPDIRQSFHTVSFLHDKAKHTSVGVGLIHHWYERGIEEGIRSFNFGLVWRKGNPRAWKGYSAFKKQFDLHLVLYPKALWKFFW